VVLGGGGGVKSHGGDKCPSQYHFSDPPPPPLKFEEHGGVQIFLCPLIRFWGCVKVKLWVGRT
jgi:hypothetical protein